MKNAQPRGTTEPTEPGPPPDAPAEASAPPAPAGLSESLRAAIERHNKYPNAGLYGLYLG